MASRPEFGSEIDKALFATATRIARDKRHLHKSEIADRAGMSQRMLHRLLTGKTRATEEQRERILRACSLPAMTSRLLAESNQIDLIGTGSQDWLEDFVKSVVGNLVSIKEETGMEVESRWAASDAALILARWQSLIERRRSFLAEYFPGDWSRDPR